MTQENKNKQPQAEPYIVKSHDIHIDNDYADWIADIKNRYRSAQVKTVIGELQYTVYLGIIKFHQISRDIQQRVSKSYNK